MRATIGWAITAAMLAGAPALAAQACENSHSVRVADLGFHRLRCDGCNITQRNGQRPQISFEREPGLLGIHGPGEGKLREGDVLVAVDGRLITTAEGGRRYSNVDPGERVTLSVRRGGQVQDVTVVAGTRCTSMPVPPAPPAAPSPPPRTSPPAPPAPPAAPGRVGAAPTPPRAPSAPRISPPVPPAPPTPPEVMPDGWFGFGIQCTRCEIMRRNEETVFRFRELPTVVSVEPGTPAARAGLRRGDRLTHVDGLALTTDAGGRRFNAIQPGQQVRWTYTRDGGSRQATLTAVRRPDAGRAPAASAQRLRYSGTVGGAEVEVRGAPVNVSTDPRTGEMVIRSADVTVRIKP